MNILAVLVGGLLGTGLRLGIDALIPHELGEFPVSTLLINVSGSLALGFLVARVWPTAPEWVRFGLGTGFLGSFTTFSAVVVAIGIPIQPLVSIGYLVLTVGLGLGAAALGLRLGRRQADPSPEIGPDE